MASRKKTSGSAGKKDTRLYPSEDLLRRARDVRRRGAIKRQVNVKAHESSMLEIVSLYLELAATEDSRRPVAPREA